MIHRYLWQALKLFSPHLKASNILFCPPHISGSQQETEIADHHSLVITLATFPRNCQKSPCDSQNIFFPPLPTTSKVVLLLPTVSDGHHKLCFHTLRFVYIGDTHTRKQICLGQITATSHRRNDFTNVMQTNRKCRFKSSLNVNYKHNIFVLNAEYMLNSCRVSLPFSLLCCTALHSPK